MAKSRVTSEPPFRAYATAGQEISKRLALETKKLEVAERRTALMESQARERREAREKKQTDAADKRVSAVSSKPHADFAARRAEMDAILETAREEITDQLLMLCEEWQSSSDITVARCCADVLKFTKTLQ